MKTFDFYAGGEWRKPASGEYFASQNPADGTNWAQIAKCNAQDVDLAVHEADKAFREGPWPTCSATERGHILRRMGDAIVKNAAELGAIECRDNGKRLVEIVPALESWLTETYYYYAGLADKIEGGVIPVGTPDMLNYTKREPFGVVAAITAWNSPLLLAAWKIAPALAAGNTVVLKPSEFASASTLAMMKVFEDEDVGLPPGVLNVVTGFGAEVGAPLVNHPAVRKVSFTGSVEGGKRVAQDSAQQIKSVTMELGGKSPQIIFDDADIEAALTGVISGIFPPSGQSCIAGSRVLVHKNIHDEFVGRLIERCAQLRVGDPFGPDTQVGPIANRPHFDRVLTDIANADQEGAVCVHGGKALNPGGLEGWFIEPTVFTDVSPDMRLARHEVFGPVLAVLQFQTEQDAVRIANDTFFGLAAGIWTQDYRRAIDIADKIEAGTVYINNYFDASASSPVGGYKQSGYGRECGMEGLNEYLQTKSIWLNFARETAAGG